MKRNPISFVLILVCIYLPAFFSAAYGQEPKANPVMMQYFEWFIPNDGTFWKTAAAQAPQLRELGITAVWLPPAYKGGDSSDVGYTAYDWYDLGEFKQHGALRTKYGTKQEYLDAINALHENQIHVYADIVFNHKGAADGVETVTAVPVEQHDRNQTSGPQREISAWTKFDFAGRNNQYSEFKWRWRHFDGVDFDHNTKENKIFRFVGENKAWDDNVDPELGNFDYLLFADVDFQNPEVVKELTTWGKWHLDQTGIDGFRIDAVKHIDYTFFTGWLKELRRYTGKELFAVGEFYSSDVDKLLAYIKNSQHCMSLFDFPLQQHFNDASKANGRYDMKKLYSRTLTGEKPEFSVTFVENHDTQYGRGNNSFVENWFKPLAYTFIMTRRDGYPCLFYGDYYGVPSHNQPALKEILKPILQARKLYAYGIEHDYLDDPNIAGWTREGDPNRPGSGLAAIIADGAGGIKRMYVGKHNAGKKFEDLTRNNNDVIMIDSEGQGLFCVNDRSWSIWAAK